MVVRAGAITRPGLLRTARAARLGAALALWVLSSLVHPGGAAEVHAAEPAGSDGARPEPTLLAPEDGSDADPDPEQAGPELRADDQPAAPAGGSDVDDADALDVYWNEGVNYRWRPLHAAPGPLAQYDRNVALEGRIGLRLAVDAAGFDASGSLPSPSATADVRRFFLYTAGKFRLVYPIVFKVEVGLVEASLYLDNFYIGAADVPYAGSVRAGQFDAPMSLDRLSGSSSRTFMESPAPVQAFAPGQKAGVQVASFSERYHLSWQAGLFTDGQRQDVGDATRDVLRAVGRLVWRDLERPPERDLLHLGVSASYVLSSSDRVRYRSRPESFLAPFLVNTGDLEAENVLLVGAEAAVRRGPTSIQGELLASFVRSRALDDPALYGGYVELAHTLTGESRLYERALGVFGRLIPRHDLDPWRGAWGAFEVAARFSAVDLNDADVRGGRMALFGGGLNWYWNRHVRLMFGYELAFVRSAPETGNFQVFQGRVQLVL